MQPPLKDIVREIRSLEPFPEVATRVLAIASQEQSGPRELIEVIQVDPGLTGKVLRLCNSAYYGFQREIATLEEAGNLLGVRTLVNLVLTSCAGRYFKQNSGGKPSERRAQWRSNVTHAIAARLIAETNRLVDKEHAYTTGLLQNIGCMVLDRFFQDSEAHVTAVVAQGYPLIEAEKYALGLHHAELGARLMTRWDLPEILTDTVRFHHAPEKATIDTVLTSTVHLAETMAAARLEGDSRKGMAYEVSEAALELTGMDPSDFERIDVDLVNELNKAQELLDF